MCQIEGLLNFGVCRCNSLKTYILFSDAAATGEWTYTPTSGVMPHTDETVEEFHSPHDAEFHDDADLEAVHPSELNKKRLSNTDGSANSSKTKKKFSDAALLNKTLDRIVNVVESSSATSTQTLSRYPSRIVLEQLMEHTSKHIYLQISNLV
ncbi:unnamed protein product [Camellia sinensis]